MSKILIIDDDLDIQETMGSLLEHEGFEIHSAETVEKGMAMIASTVPDLILLDVMFPEKKTRGFEAAINREYAFDFSKQDVKAEEFLNKPVKIDRLIKLIRNYI
jgi:DNA-binding NtrC family response regulator